jgi:hypothetical protein
LHSSHENVIEPPFAEKQENVMIGQFRRLYVSAILAGLASGCCSCDFPSWGGPALSLDSSKIGTGQQAIAPRNDAEYANGEPMNLRTGK